MSWWTRLARHHRAENPSFGLAEEASFCYLSALCFLFRAKERETQENQALPDSVLGLHGTIATSKQCLIFVDIPGNNSTIIIMKVRSKRSKILFRGRTHLSAQQNLKSSSNVKTLESSNSKRMTSVKHTKSTHLDDPAEFITSDSLEQPILQIDKPASSSGSDDFPLPELFASLPPIRDSLVTGTSRSQDETAAQCLPFHTGASRSIFDLTSYGIPRLNRESHVDFLTDIIQTARHVAFDPLRPWVIYWSLTGLGVLGEDLAQWRDRVVETCTPMQNPSGGFGGGHGQTSHAASSYAAVLSLAMVGGNEALELIDRRAL